jgi:hypothetical protein
MLCLCLRDRASFAAGIDHLSLGNFMVREMMSAVPEPARWAMLIAGFGMVGVAIRSRRQQRTRISYAA